MGAGLYLHVPFCRRKCPYCNFYSVPAQPELLTAYTAAVCRNLRHYGNAVQPERVDTVYFGGGTPSLLLPAQIAQILETAAEQFALSADAEITLEANPATVTPEQLRELRHAGINRLSLGVQSLSDAQLKRLGRLHTAQEAVETVYAAAEAGFRNLSCDLMLALPEQTADELEQTISRLVQLPITHVSAYLLKVEQGTPFAVQHVAECCPDDDTAADLYLQAVEQLGAAGFLQYEISNFARPGYESRHNLKYWRCEEYLGLGPAAASCFGGRRFAFPRDIDAFLSAKHPWSLCEDEGEAGSPEERVAMALRLCEGLDCTALEQACPGFDAGALIQRASRPELKPFCTVTGRAVALTPQGFLLEGSLIPLLL